VAVIAGSSFMNAMACARIWSGKTKTRLGDFDLSALAAGSAMIE
jgi:hypothetical protein